MGTWNVNGKDVNESLDKWLIGGEAVPDIYAIGFQELDLSAETFLLNNSQKAERWETKIEASLAKQVRAPPPLGFFFGGEGCVVFIFGLSRGGPSLFGWLYF